MTRANTAISILMTAMISSSGFAQSVNPIEELKVCAKMTDDDARLACYDGIGERALSEEPADTGPTQKVKVQPEAATEDEPIVMPLPDELGGPKNVQYVGLITSCKKGHYGDWYFIFENEQVWKDVNNRNLRFKECHFNATITKSMFGYKMRIEGLDRNIRVTRVK